MRKSFESVYKSISGPLKRFIAKRAGQDEQVVEEIFSATMTAAWTGFKTFEKKSSYFTWICRIALNKIADYYRHEIHSRSTFMAPLLEDLVEPEAMSPLEQLALSELQTTVQRALGLLPESSRKILHLRYWEDASLTEIAKLLNISPKAAESKLYRARKALAKVL